MQSLYAATMHRRLHLPLHYREPDIEPRCASRASNRAEAERKSKEWRQWATKLAKRVQLMRQQVRVAHCAVPAVVRVWSVAR